VERVAGADGHRSVGLTVLGGATILDSLDGNSL